MKKGIYADTKTIELSTDPESKAIQMGQKIYPQIKLPLQDQRIAESPISRISEQQREQILALLRTRQGLIALGNGWISEGKIQQWRRGFGQPDEFGSYLVAMLEVFITPKGIKAASTGLIPDPGMFLIREGLLELLITERGQGLLATKVIDLSTIDGFRKLTDIGQMTLKGIIDNPKLYKQLTEAAARGKEHAGHALDSVVELLKEHHRAAIMKSMKR